jgi:hypothetical protein
MRHYLFYILCLYSLLSCKGQRYFGANMLHLEKEIAMPEVTGRIDHMAVNSKDNVVYVAALGNNTVEVIDILKGKIVRTIKGISEPQGIAYLPEQNEIAVASGGNGDCVFINTTTAERVATVHLTGDADNIRYDPIEKRIYVGYGDGGIAMIDAVTHKQIGSVKLPAHPESFQLDKKNNHIYVNVPGDKSIWVIDLKTFTASDRWKLTKYRANFPMTFDTAHDVLFVGFRHPASLVSYDCYTGKQLSINDLVDDVDDIFYNADKQEIIASGGGGSINIFKRENKNTYKKVCNIKTEEGSRTSLLVSSLQTFILAERAKGDKAAAIALFSIKE